MLNTLHVNNSFQSSLFYYPWFCSLNLLFSDVPVAVAVVDFLKSLMVTAQKHGNMESICLFVITKLTTTDKVFFIIKSFNITRKLPFAHFGEHEKEPCDVIYYLYKMEQSHWLLYIAMNCDWSRKITPLSNLTRVSLPEE